MKIRAYLVFFTFLFSVLCAAQAKPDFEKMDNEADQLQENGKYSEAIALYKKLVEHNYEKSRMLNMMGMCYFYQKNYEKAKQSFRMASLYDKNDDATVLSNVGAAFNEMDDYKKGFEYAMKALLIETNEQTVLNAVATANNMNDYAKAEEIYHKYADMNVEIKNYNPLRCVIGRTFYHNKKYFESVNAYELFFENYVADKTFPVLIENEKTVFWKAMIRAAMETVDVGESMADPSFMYQEKIAGMYPAVVSQNGEAECLKMLELLGYYILPYRPEQKTWFGNVLRNTTGGADVFASISVLRLSGKYGEALELLKKMDIKNFAGTEKTSEEKLLRIEIEKYITRILQYNQDFLTQHTPGRQAEEQIVAGLQEIEQAIRKGVIIPQIEAAATITQKLFRSWLYIHQRKDNKEFIKKLILVSSDYNENKAAELIKKIQEKGQFN